ncbi:MAG: arginase family protein [Acidobacteriota bacterium]
MSESSSRPDPPLRLLPSLRAARLGRACYLYDDNARHMPVVFVPTQRVKTPIHDAVVRLRQANPENVAWPLDTIIRLFEDEQQRKAVELLMRRGYLEPRPEADGPAEGGRVSPSFDIPALIRDFTEREVKHYFNPLRLFNLPRDIEDDDVHVGFVGVPYASNPLSAGTVSGPAMLRAVSQRVAFWFDVCARGVYSEVGLDGGFPELLCQGLVVQDYGDFGAGIKTVGDLFADVRGFVDQAVTRRIPIVYAGGDHAITFPIVAAYLKHFPDLALIHLDAHNDLLYSERITFNHSAPISNLLLGSALQDVYSLGLRTEIDTRVASLRSFAADPDLAARVHGRSIGSLKRILADARTLDALIAEIGPDRPCYLTVDLDVLSASAIASQLSTPSGAGLEWWELLELARVFTRRLNTVACDIVEFNVPERSGSDDARPKPAFLLLQLFHGLAQGRPWREARISPANNGVQ